jgi:LysR family transcriptional regulator, benzoate and cis,cis-muconate-responsive activator of ben and cat genes
VLDLRRLRYFMAVASAESFSRAADALWEDMRGFASGERGRVTIGYSTSIGYETAPRLIRVARETLPDVAVTSVVLPSVELPGAVLDGPVDVALARCAADTAGLERTVVRRERLGTLVPASHRVAALEAADVGDLRDEPLLLHDPAANPRHHALIVQVCRDAGFEPRLVPVGAPFDRGYATIAQGEAVSIVGESARDGLPAALAWVPLRTPRRVEISLLVRAGAREPSVGRAAEAMLADARTRGWV